MYADDLEVVGMTEVCACASEEWAAFAFLRLVSTVIDPPRCNSGKAAFFPVIDLATLSLNLEQKGLPRNGRIQDALGLALGERGACHGYVEAVTPQSLIVEPVEALVEGGATYAVGKN